MKYTVALLAVVLSACSPGAEREYGYDQIMPPELKDCKVFKINDGIRSLFVTRCGMDTTTSWSENCGKNCTRHLDSTLIAREARHDQ